MTAAERSLLLALFRWARAAGVANIGWRGNPIWRMRGGRTWIVSHQRHFWGISAGGAGGAGGHVDYRCTTISQAVDILAALGIVPAKFSTAYRAGWDAAGSVVRRPAEIFPAHATPEPESEPAR